ncbi:MAG: hydrolase [Myxococcales bacterium]|nr:hydrolase [Myxococcales bacterium]
MIAARRASAALLIALAGCGEAAPGAEDLATMARAIDAAALPDAAIAPLTDAALPQPDLAAAPYRCVGRTGAKGDQTIQVASGGAMRSALLHVPASYDPQAGAMLVLDFHGYLSDPIQQDTISKMKPLSDGRGFLLAYPQGSPNSFNAGACCGAAAIGKVDDIAFVRALIAHLSAAYCVDPKRVHATGLSNGGFLSYRLACEAADTIAAIAPVAAVLGIPKDDCKPTRPVPVLAFHGTMDPLVLFGGGAPGIGGAQGANFPSVAETIALWRQRDGCADASQVIYAKGDAKCERWAMCKGGSDVTLCTIDGGGHTWPGGTPIPVGKTSTDIDASATMIDFFAAHPMP